MVLEWNKMGRLNPISKTSKVSNATLYNPTHMQMSGGSIANLTNYANYT